jgi:hypothetical protein
MKKIEACFFIPVCKSDKKRVLWTIKSIRKYCSDYMIYVLIDGIREEFEGAIEPAEDLKIIYIDKPTNRHWGLIWRMQNNGMREALSRNDLDDECIFVKIDADAVITRPGFIKTAQQFFSAHPTAGQVGQVFTNIVGLPLDNPGWESYFKNRLKPAGLLKLWGKYINEGFGPLKAYNLTAQFRRIILGARKNGYHNGCFAIGGSYMLRKRVVELMEENGFLLNSPFCFIPDVGEDVLMTPHVYFVGYQAMDSIGKEGLFAVYGKELIAPPQKFKEEGNYIVHPFKYGVTQFIPTMTEDELAEILIAEHNNQPPSQQSH